MIRSLSMEVDMAATALGPEPDPLKVLTIAADKIKLLPFSFLDTLADLACQTSPMKIKGGPHTDDIGILGQSLASTKRPRAYSESWVGQGSSGGWPTKTEFLDMKKEGLDGGALLPQMLDNYAEIYNKNGRIGIYTRQERDEIIERFREKKRRRVWKKKIRYHCRKNLADRRVRVKGRFVRRGDKDGDGAPSPSGDGSLEGEDEEIADEEDSGGDEGTGADGDVATSSSSGDGVELGSKRLRTEPEKGSNKKKKHRHVVFDESAVESSSTSETPTTGIAHGVSNGEAVGGDNTDRYSPSGGQRMRRHSIAY